MDSTEEIKDRLSIDEVVGDYLQLKPAGSNLKGLCPFHDEKTPSFTVSPDKGIYHCFGCSEGGDIFTFVEKMDGLDFRAALEKLAQKAGVDLPSRQGDGQKQRQHKQRLKEALNMAAQYYHIQLGRHQVAKDYVVIRRQINKDTIKKFKLGFAPAGDKGLSNFLTKQGFSEKELLDAGLLKRRGSRLGDVFRDRLMVPFFDLNGDVIGFTGRVLGDSLPKYLNTPQTALFDKSRFVFGLYQAKDSIRTSDEVVVVEGNLDVLTSHQAGVDNVVAISGTALTAAQIKQLARLGKNFTLAFDADAAGLKATERALPLVQAAGAAMYIVKLPEGSDPDDIIRRDPKEWQRIIDNKTYVMDWWLETLAKAYDTDTPQGKRQLTDRATDALQRLKDPVEHDHYIQKIASMLNVSPAAVAQKATKPEKGSAPNRTAAVKAETGTDELRPVCDALLSLAAAYPDTRKALEELDVNLIPEPIRKTGAYLKNSHNDIDLEHPPEDLQSDLNYVKILVLRGEEEYGSWSALDRQVEAFSLIHRLHKLQTKKHRQQLSRQIAAAEAAGDYDLRQKLLKEFKQL